MSYCINVNCQEPENSDTNLFCLNCNSELVLKERYRSQKLIGQGGFSKTYLAIDEHKPSHPPCVIKQFHPLAQGTNNAEKAAELFKREAQRLETLGKHSQIAELLAHFDKDNCQYLVQEYIPGKNLAEELETEGVFNEIQIKDLLNSLLPVLEFVRSHNIVHRDIKPENIIRRQRPEETEGGELVLVDFGAAKHATGTALLKTGTIIGTPEYVAPEQLKGKADFGSDLYSLGVVCLHLLTNLSPFQLFDTGESKWVWRDYLNGNSVGEELVSILDKLIAEPTNHRYHSAAEVLRELNAKPKAASAPKVEISSVLGLSKNSWQKPQTLTDFTASVSSVTIAADSNTLISGCFDKTIKFWNLATGELVNSLTASDPVLAIAFHPAKAILACGYVDGCIAIWNLQKKAVSCIGQHSNNNVSMSVAFSPDGKAIGSCSDDSYINLWDLETGELIHNFQQSRGINVIAFSPNGQILASGSSGNVIKFWNMADGEQIGELVGHSQDINSIAFSPDGENLVSGSSDTTIKLWSVASGELLNTFVGHTDWVRSVIFP
ncbi:MAG: serine/threonine-protein kinase, partial [Cyanobacteriota bacterium]|nr:serine/threonine-protein kinase [Cyanobacteriota bacterium]